MAASGCRLRKPRMASPTFGSVRVGCGRITAFFGGHKGAVRANQRNQFTSSDFKLVFVRNSSLALDRFNQSHALTILTGAQANERESRPVSTSCCVSRLIPPTVPLIASCTVCLLFPNPLTLESRIVILTTLFSKNTRPSPCRRRRRRTLPRQHQLSSAARGLICHTGAATAEHALKHGKHVLVPAAGTGSLATDRHLPGMTLQKRPKFGQALLSQKLQHELLNFQLLFVR